MGLRSGLEKQWNLSSRLRTWLHYIANDFDRYRLNPPIRTIIQSKNGKQYEELLNEPDWIALGYVPQPTTKLGWFIHHTIHGIAMHYPLRCVIAFAFLNSPPDSGRRSSKIQTETMKDNRIDLWLDSADLIALSQFANRYKTSYQRIIETALTQAVARRLVNAEVSDYKRVQRIPLRLDQLGREQIKILSAMTDASDQDVLRLALQSLFTNAIDHSLYD